ncbi:MAG: type II toxin-antitoxin system prevent-host-death family antitoxin [Proteobacteria bacterium]|nr:type II toxin-antitoxin system prevent-host-death family antitoxin [Pseudomonadota bacterium]
MYTINFSEFRSKLAASMDRVTSNHKPMIVTRGNEKAAIVVMSLDDYRSYEETAYLMSSANNAKRLNESINEIEQGLGVKHKLIED